MKLITCEELKEKHWIGVTTSSSSWQLVTGLEAGYPLEGEQVG